ncbi:hypothetical protein QBC43DRAFT_323399 [Cladorrhinum sp. PSN259]|nr:hypothetical protein QBC43DRAFT_323399 [Cladorrhinum sp. PSN259]
MASLDGVPDEIIRHILHFIPPEDILDSVQLVSHRFYRVAKEPLLWRWLCLKSFKYWHPNHRIEDKVKAPAPHTDWKALWITRTKKNVGIARLMEGILSTNQDRIKRIEKISKLGYDAKDYLLEQLHCDDSKEDALCRRYYADATLDSLHKGIAVDLWYQYQGNPLCIRGLDKALAAFDQCIVRDQPHDIEYVLRTLDEYAERFRSENSQFKSLTTRGKAVSLVRWLRRNNLVGTELPGASFRNLRNCFIGHALSDETHPALPIISSAIYVCVAERLGLVATCLSFPSHVHAAVFAPPGEDPDGNPTSNPEKTNLARVYIDPYGSDQEVTVRDLRLKLQEFGWSRQIESFLNPSSVPAIVQRAAHHIKTTWTADAALQDHARSVEMTRLRTGLPPGFDLDAAYSAALWADLLSKQAESPHWDSTLDDLLARVLRETPEDAWLVKRYISPMYERFARAWPARGDRTGARDPRKAVEMIENLDARKPEVSRRYTELTKTKVLYKIGQVFRHRRYRYIGIINGWACHNHALPSPAPFYVTPEDVHDMAGLQHGHGHHQQNGTGQMANGHHGGRRSNRPNPDKVYYTCMSPGYDHLRLSQDNVEIIKDSNLIPEQLFIIAGKFFKRFDRKTCTFVSNMKEIYPDD